jgi:DNA-binding transcriptional ArsR family regulator
VPRSAADATVFHAIADPNRRAILELLMRSELAVSALLESFSITQSALSQHLAVLVRAGLVVARREGRHRIYTVNADPLREVADWVEPFEKFWDEKLDNLGKYLDRHRAAGAPTPTSNPTPAPPPKRAARGAKTPRKARR